jgi:hypothetical protein
MKPARQLTYTEYGEPNFDAAFLRMLAGAVRRHIQQGKATTAQRSQAPAVTVRPAEYPVFQEAPCTPS